VTTGIPSVRPNVATGSVWSCSREVTPCFTSASDAIRLRVLVSEVTQLLSLAREYGVSFVQNEIGLIPSV
jgi:hypothetical protein